MAATSASGGSEEPRVPGSFGSAPLGEGLFGGPALGAGAFGVGTFGTASFGGGSNLFSSKSQKASAFGSTAVPSQQPSLNLFGSVTGQYPLQGGLFSTPKEENTSTFQVFDNPRAQKLLGLIDHLRQNGLSQDVALPELVVTGNQSSGKSSLLESLTGLPFPSSARVCTRFTTKVSLRRSPIVEFKASIISSKKFPTTTFPKEPTREEFKGLLDRVSKKLGVEESGFSADILHIEISGPDRNPLSFMDTPGLFVSGSVSQKTEDSAVVEKLVLKQIESPRAIIVAVMAARDNTETQSVWSVAEQVDPECFRTVGVLTKCDLLAEGGEQENALLTVRNKVKVLQHGWYAVKNRSDMDTRNNKSLKQSREDENAEFSKEIWSKVPRSRVGILALKKHLEELLCEHITKELPKLQADVFKSLRNAESALAALGPARPTGPFQRQHLINIAEAHVESMKGQLEHTHGNTESYNFWNRIQKLREEFQGKMHRGALYPLGPSTDKIPSIETFKGYLNVAKRNPLYSRPESTTYQWLIHRYEYSRGRELPGRIDSKLIDSLFMELTVEWKWAADFYIFQVQEELKSCFDSCLKPAVSDTRMFTFLKKHLSLEQDEIIHNLKKAVSQHIEHDRRNVSTTNPGYEERIIEAKANRLMLYCTELQGSGQKYVPGIDTLRSRLAEPRYTIIEIHDILKTYYDLAAQSVVDSISKQIIDPFIRGDGSPLKFFNRAYVENMSQEDVEKIAAEMPEVVLERQDLEEKINRLTEALHLSAEVAPLGIEMKTHLRKKQTTANGSA